MKGQHKTNSLVLSENFLFHIALFRHLYPTGLLPVYYVFLFCAFMVFLCVYVSCVTLLLIYLLFLYILLCLIFYLPVCFLKEGKEGVELMGRKVEKIWEEMGEKKPR